MAPSCKSPSKLGGTHSTWPAPSCKSPSKLGSSHARWTGSSCKSPSKDGASPWAAQEPPRSPSKSSRRWISSRRSRKQDMSAKSGSMFLLDSISQKASVSDASRAWLLPSLPGRMGHAGHVCCSAEMCCNGALPNGEAPISDAALRELCGVFVASVYVVRSGERPELFSPPHGPGLSGSDLTSLRAQKDACFASLARKRGSAITAAEASRLVAHLSPQPANAVLLATGCDSDQLLQPRHVVAMGPGLGLRVLTVGYIGKQRTSGGTVGGTPHVLTVAGPDLQDAARWRSDNLPGATTVAYNVRRAQNRDMARELHHHLLPALQRSLSEAEDTGTALDLDEVVLQRV